MFEEPIVPGEGRAWQTARPRLLLSMHLSGFDDGPACQPPRYRYRLLGAAGSGSLHTAPLASTQQRRFV